jgi:hypothetical protein
LDRGTTELRGCAESGFTAAKDSNNATAGPSAGCVVPIHRIGFLPLFAK